MSEATTVGLFTLGAVALTEGFGWIRRRSDREAEQSRLTAERESRKEERFAAEFARTREEGAAVVGRVRTFLTDVHPKRAAVNLNQAAMDDTFARWQEAWNELRDPLGTLAVRMPTLEGRELADQLNAAVQTAHHRANWLLLMMSRNENYMEWLRESEEEWERANDLAKQLREALHEAEPKSATQ